MNAVVSEADIFSRLFEPHVPNLSPDAAQSILALDFKESDRNRMNVLSEKAREGSLDPIENGELDKYILVGDLLAIMQSKARRALMI